MDDMKAFGASVVPYIGTWIETRKMVTQVDPTGVVPYIGTWIETKSGQFVSQGSFVVPYIGTWIETPVGGQRRSQAPCRTLYRYVD